jgi:peptidoglycan hydrolase-like protein with peptidoglycan-binding domain
MSGAATDRAVRQFQYRAGITVDGEIDSALIVQMSRSLARKYPRPPGGNQP